MAADVEAEKRKQQGHTWERSVDFTTCASIPGHYQVESVLEHARGDSLLDLACGDGLLTGQLARRFRRVVGVDAPSVHLEKARRRRPEIHFQESLIETLDLAERFDTITMLNVLEHLESPELALRRAARMLAPEGCFIIHVPNAVAINRRISVLMGSLESCEELSPFDIHVAGHRRSYTLESLKADVEAADLEIVATGGVFYKMLSMAQWIGRSRRDPGSREASVGAASAPRSHAMGERSSVAPGMRSARSAPRTATSSTSSPPHVDRGQHAHRQ